MRCTSCELNFDEKDIHEHHIHPRFMNNPRGDGKKRLLCKRCHDILHNTVQSILWRHLDDHTKEKAIYSVKVFSERFKNKRYGGDGLK